MNYDLWLGPAPLRPFNENHFHYHWHWFWEYGTTDLGNTGVHSLDAVRWLIGKQEHPRTAYCIGGLYEARRADRSERRRTRSTRPISMRTAPSSTAICATGTAVRPKPQGMYVFGAKGWMKVGDDKAQVFFGRKNEPGPVLTADEKGDAGQVHFQNFIDMRALAQGRRTCARRSRKGTCRRRLCHLGNIAYRVGRSVKFDGATERFVGDAEADKLLGRTYRAPYVLPDKT